MNVDTVTTQYTTELAISAISTVSTQFHATHTAISHNHVRSLPLAHLRCHAHQHNRALQAHLPSLHLSLGPTPLLIQTHRPGTETMRQPESMGSTKTLMGKRTGITMTIKKSMASLSLDQFDNRLLLKSWTSRGVTLCHYPWPSCCTNKPTITGFGSWLMVVKFT